MDEADTTPPLVPRGRTRSRSGRASSLLFLVESWVGTDEDVVGFLERTELFAGLPADDLRDLLAHLRPVHLAGGDDLLVPGEVVDALHVVGHGRLVVETCDGGRHELGPGQVFGEVALLGPRAGTDRVTAVRDSVVLRLSATAFTEFATRHPAALLGLCRHVVGRAATPAADDPAPAPASTTVALVPLDDVDVGPLVEGLTRGLAPYGSSTLVDAATVDRRFEPGASRTSLDDPRNGALVAWLQRVEARHRVVFVRAEVAEPTWTARCLRQADRVLLVAAADRPPALDPRVAEHLERLPRACRTDLVLLHPAGTTAPSGTAAWRDRVDVTMHHHVRQGERGDLERLARHLVGRARGLVLGGGGARGFAHLGVLQALDELGIEVDVIAGSSIGAVMGALCAAGLDHQARLDSATRALVEPGRLAPATLPLVSFSSGRRINRLLQAEDALAGDIEDLWRPFYCVSASLDRVAKVVHDRGPTWRAVRASVSLPGLWPPVHTDGELLVDGGILDNLPVEDMAPLIGSGPVIAVDLDASDLRDRSDPFDVSLSGWRIFARRLNPFRPGPHVPGIFDVILRSATLASTTAQRDRLARRPVAVHLRPPLGPGGLLDFSTAPSLVEPARAYALEHLAEHVEVLTGAGAPSGRGAWGGDG